MEDQITVAKTDDNVEKMSTTASCSTTYLLELESKTNENQSLSEKVLKAKFTIEQLEKLIMTSAMQLGQLTAEYAKAKKERCQLQEEADQQSDYQMKEIETLKAELELSKSLLEGRIKRLERMNQRNTALQNEVNNNRYKIFSMHFKSSAEDEDTEHTVGNDESSPTATELSTDATSGDDDDDETSKSTTTVELDESTNENYSS